MDNSFLNHLGSTLAGIESDGLYKRERLISGPQGGQIDVVCEGSTRKAVNLCSNNYLGLANHPSVVEAAAAALRQYGFGMASVRFICGTQTLHRELEQRIARLLRKDDAILFPACFDANGGVFEPLLGAEDAIVSDALNHASIIDGVRLSKARRFRFASGNMDELEDRLKEARRLNARFVLIVTVALHEIPGFATLSRFAALNSGVADGSVPNLQQFWDRRPHRLR